MLNLPMRLQSLFSWKQSLSSLLLGLLVSCGICLTDSAALAATAPSQQAIETLQVHLGNQAGAFVFEPDQFIFDAGKRYKLLLDNPSPTKHYFTAKDFSDVIWTQKVEAGNVEVKGAIHELELKPGAEAEWVFVPQKPGTYELHCSIAGHAEAGMVGEISIAIAPS
ncbi:MAG: cupredoxin domain-containing protein [Cyanobacteria bacterium P01_B01_bin.77]